MSNKSPRRQPRRSRRTDASMIMLLSKKQGNRDNSSRRELVISQASLISLLAFSAPLMSACYLLPFFFRFSIPFSLMTSFIIPYSITPLSLAFLILLTNCTIGMLKDIDISPLNLLLIYKVGLRVFSLLIFTPGLIHLVSCLAHGYPLDWNILRFLLIYFPIPISLISFALSISEPIYYLIPPSIEKVVRGIYFLCVFSVCLGGYRASSYSSFHVIQGHEDKVAILLSDSRVLLLDYDTTRFQAKHPITILTPDSSIVISGSTVLIKETDPPF